ncbi:unnamed protein product [Fraxinus pennsylvanica]|uniref:Wound-induced protein 1 n=1 Tax=Fraxinus pennsylvanica TaxID=56036 RepID=A0AAD1Z331_9LAMI|nr:unnamed protein product [Fraxinus pennsylvanica]
MDAKNVDTTVAVAENQNKATVNALYKAVATGDATTVAGVVTSDLEWWFHGPQNCHHMMKMLTGISSPSAFKFEPRSIDAIDDCVIVEGWEGAQVYWVHVWSLKDGLITQFREYFNTWLTVTDFRSCLSSILLWESHPKAVGKRSLPELMLAI